MVVDCMDMGRSGIGLCERMGLCERIIADVSLCSSSHTPVAYTRKIGRAHV